MIERLQLENFTAFTKLDISFSPGINIFVGENGTGKTHVLKVLYSFLFGDRDNPSDEAWKHIYYRKMLDVFMPFPKHWDSLLKKGNDASSLEVIVTYNGKSHSVQYDIKRSPSPGPFQTGNDFPIIDENPVLIPVNETLTNTPGLLSLYAEREIFMSEVYPDLIYKVFLPKKREIAPSYAELCKKLEYHMGGSVFSREEHFYIHGIKFDLEFSLLAEGLKKLGLLWVLLQNGSLDKGSVLFWDEPEANMNPSLLKVIIEVLLELQRNGVQIFIATHNYIVLKEFDIQKTVDDRVRFFSFMRGENDISVQYGENYLDIVPNKISEAYTEVYNKEVQRSLGGKN